MFILLPVGRGGNLCEVRWPGGPSSSRTFSPRAAAGCSRLRRVGEPPNYERRARPLDVSVSVSPVFVLSISLELLARHTSTLAVAAPMEPSKGDACTIHLSLILSCFYRSCLRFLLTEPGTRARGWTTKRSTTKPSSGEVRGHNRSWLHLLTAATPPLRWGCRPCRRWAEEESLDSNSFPKTSV